jgi:hypothetical protein
MSNTTIVVIDKSGELRERAISNLNERDIFKYAGFKTDADFNKHAGWKIRVDDVNYNIVLYGKESGKATRENKYEFPPPSDNILFFDNCVLLNKNDDNTIGNLTATEWEIINVKLNKGFLKPTRGKRRQRGRRRRRSRVYQKKQFIPIILRIPKRRICG